MKTENKDIRKYLYKFIPNVLKDNLLFVKIFGENFAKKRIKQNVLTVFTNELSPINGFSAYQSPNSKSITFCSSINDNDNKLTLDQIIKNIQLLKTALHECLHAILQRTKRECKKYNIYTGTGLLEIFRDGSEIGRGANEGYIEWMCEKLGYESTSYKELTNFVRLIEAAIGTEKTMSLGKGGTQSNFPKLLNLTQESTNFLLGLSDQVYLLYKRANCSGTC